MSTISQRTPLASAASTRRPAPAALPRPACRGRRSGARRRRAGARRTASVPGLHYGAQGLRGEHGDDGGRWRGALSAGHPHRCGAPSNRPRLTGNADARPAVRHPHAARRRRGRRPRGSPRCSDAGVFILGPEVEAFEAEFAAYLGVAHAIGVANGTDAITIALRALGVGPGDEVVVPSFTFYATRRGDRRRPAPRRCSATSTRRRCNVTAETVRAALTPRTKAVRRRRPVRQSSRRSRRSRRSACRWSRTPRRRPARASTAVRAGALGTLATFSFYPSKNLGCFGDGGAITTDDDALAERARVLRFHGSRDKADVRARRLQLAPRRAAGGDPARAAAARSTAGADGRRAAARAYADAGLGELVALPVATAGRRAGLAPVRRPPRTRRRAGGGAERRRDRRARLLPHAAAPPAGDARRAPPADLSLPGTEERRARTSRSR